MSAAPRNAKRKRDETTFEAIRLALERGYKQLRRIRATRTEFLEYLEKEMEHTVTQGDVARVEQKEKDLMTSSRAQEDDWLDKVDTLELRLEDRQDVMVAFAMVGLDNKHPLGKHAEVGLRDMILRLS
jgi:hypothetical protein